MAKRFVIRGGEAILTSPLMNATVNVGLSGAWLFFALRHVRAFLETGQYAYLLFGASETFLAGLFLLRRMPRSVSDDPSDWVVALGGTVAPLFLVPGGTVVSAFGGRLIVAGVVIQIFAAVSLGRSFAIVAANRTVKTRGLYHFVRHPMYASYLPLHLGYLALNASPANVSLIAVALILLFLRVRAEEKHLARDPTYIEYMSRVRWRLVPFLL